LNKELFFSQSFIANAQAMMDAVIKISTRGVERCRFSPVITGQVTRLEATSTVDVDTPVAADAARLANLNESQRQAVLASKSPLSLIWGPPGSPDPHLFDRP
jgi:hypothetical protein